MDNETDAVLEKYPFLAIKETDDFGMQSMKTHWQVVLAMPLPERQVFYQQEHLEMEEYYLASLTDSIGTDNELMRAVEIIATTNLKRYQQLAAFVRATPGDSQHWAADMNTALDLAEQAAENLRLLKEHKRTTLGEIKAQRERVQWERKKLREMQTLLEKNTEPKPSSSPLPT